MVFQCLKHSLIQALPTRLVWFYKEGQPIYVRILQILPQTEFAPGINNEILEKNQSSNKNLVVLEYFLTIAGDSKQISKLITQEGRRRNFTVIFLVQNLFYQLRDVRTISRNAHYHVTTHKSVI